MSVLWEYMEQVGADPREVQDVDARWYANVISSCEFFGDRISRCYTVAGYIPYKLIARNPYSEAVETYTREYSFA